MREKQLLGFKPLHPAVRYFCQLCGTEVSADNHVTRYGRNIEAGLESDAHIFCKKCGPEIDRIVNLLAGEDQRIRLEQEADREKLIREIAENELGLLSDRRQHDGGGSSAPPSDERLSPRSPRRRAQRNGMIPNPTDA